MPEMYPVLPSQPNFPQQEEEILAFWKKERVFEQSLEKNRGKTPFVIYDGPPTANARPPLHTIVPMSFKDLVGRYQTMRGYYVPRQAGWDTHGLPVEVQIEKKLGLSGKKEILNLVPGDETASIEKFNAECRQSVWEFKQDWDRFVPRVGYWVDIERPYITYETGYLEKVWATFKRIWEKGLVYKGYKVVPYCPRCGTPLSSHEVAQEYHEVKDVSVYVTFPLADNPDRHILAWTTTPWTLPGNVALAVGKEIDYVVVSQGEREYVLAKARLEILRGEYHILEEFKGEKLIGLKYQPLYREPLKEAKGKKFEVVGADFVTTEDGTGVVHTAVMYGEDDFNLGQKEGLAMCHTVGPDGVFLPNVSQFAGQYVKDALVPILKSLNALGRLYAKESITHSYPFCWRCKTALIYYATDSWFIAMSRLRQELARANQAVEWYPAQYKNGRYGDFIKEARDWAVSRDRFWGTPLPIWISKSGKQLCIGSIDELRSLAKNPELVGKDFNPHRPYVDQIILVREGEEYLREAPILDVWFDAGAMPYASGRQEQGFFPADYIAEATDQTRGWFYTLQAISTILDDVSSYKRVVCMGVILDSQGKKMSKSAGNVLDPWEVFSQIGVDAIRWYLFTVNSAGEAKAFGIKEVQVAFRKSLLLLWNVFNFYLTYANLQQQAAPTLAERKALRESQSKLSLLDRWLQSRQAKLIEAVTKELDAYDFTRASRLLEQYIDELSTWYLRRSRKRDDPTFFTVLYEAIWNLSHLLAPFTPFLSEKIYQTLRRSEDAVSVHLADWPEATPAEKDEALEEEMQRLRQLVELGLSLRAEEKIKVRQPLAAAYINLPKGDSLSPELKEILKDELNVEEVREVGVLDVAFPQRSLENIALGLDTRLTEALVQAGQARELLRQIQQLRKEKGLQPGKLLTLIIDPSRRNLVEPLLLQFPSILKDTYLEVDPQKSWQPTEKNSINLDGLPVFIDLQ